MERPSPSTHLLTVVLVLLLLAPLLLARELGGSHESLHVRSPLMLPSDGDGDRAVVVPPELDELPGGVGRPGGRVPPSPKPSPRPKPLHELSPPPSHGLGSSSPPGRVSRRQGLSPPPQENPPPPHYRRSGPAAGVLGAIGAFPDALFRYVVGA